MRNHNSSGKVALVAESPDGHTNHICTYPSRHEAEEARKRLQNADAAERALLGYHTDDRLYLVEA